jgi:ATP-dependent RNA helicase DeaD
MKEFEKLGVDKSTLKIVKQMGFEKPTEIQKKTIPLIISGNDVIGQSATGSGKTFAFLAGIIPKIDPIQVVQALIVVPTRELANQVYEECAKFTKYVPINSCVVFGGTSIYEQKKQLRKADIVVATPGRLLDHLNRKNLDLKNLKILILDEADRMCDMGFYKDIQTVIVKSPKEKQVLLFSATISRDITKLEKKYLTNAKRIVVEYFVDSSKLKQEYYKMKGKEKFSLLFYLLDKQRNSKSIVFCNTKDLVDIVHHNLDLNHFNSFKLHGGISQNVRTKTINAFKECTKGVLISTDVSARGLHIENITEIYNYDLPREKDQYVHRIGRTARNGKSGRVVNLILNREEGSFLKITKNFDVKGIKKPDFKILDLKTINIRDKIDNFQNSKSYSNKLRTQKRRKDEVNRVKEKFKVVDKNSPEYLEQKEKKYKYNQLQTSKKHKKATQKKKYFNKKGR